ncbi:anthranilate phosphoribosyltransferase [Hazenella sp. IB182353]|uniref:anthranilate phosphoribosyltransferase n=1 Tax=Polycladospora coralii TaxID=2771432 RepID=UPI00174651B8|nr:anthranilate phosphoribosyltransferase [Polycladospora coralii]MBS7529081.1 anthranilate phosphoribosyltransferase [Polycladospora coralii]
MIQTTLQKIIAGTDLSRSEARDLMDQMMTGTFTTAQIAALLTALRMKGEAVSELVGFAQSMRTHALRVHHDYPMAVDTCGTGGDGGKTFNISTASAFVAAAAGVPVAKHGNRAISSKSGSADVLEALGMNIQLNADEAQALLRHTGLCFLFAPLFHQSMRHVMPTRKEMGIRTCFNLLGPMVNPAGVNTQLLGVYDIALTEQVALVLRELGVDRAIVVAGYDGLDEISISAPTRISEVKEGKVFSYDITPEQFGIDRTPVAAIEGGSAEVNARIIRKIVNNEKGAMQDVVVLNAAATIYVAGHANDLAQGVKMAREAIHSGKAKQKLTDVINGSQGVRDVS